jgi:hypothetical protein
MNSPGETERLLNDVLSEDADFRAALLGETLRRVCRRQQVRRLNQAIVTLALLFGISAMLWKPSPRESRNSAQSTAPMSSQLALVSSAPLRAAMLVESRPDTLDVISSSPGVLAIIESPAEPPFIQISDADLFALLAGRPVALVRAQGQPAALLFLNEADRAGFPVP